MLRFFVIAMTFICTNSFGQVDLKIYSGLADRFGVGIELPIAKLATFETSGSFRSGTTIGRGGISYSDPVNGYTDLTFDEEWRNNITYLNFRLKIYGNKPTKDGFFYGLYFRLNFHHNKLIDRDWSHLQFDNTLFDPLTATVESKKRYVYSGLLAGYKLNVKGKFYMEIMGGGLFSIENLASLYFVDVAGDSYTQKGTGGRENYADIILGQIGVIYRLNKSKSELQ